jgi:hypothetical protein
MDRRHSTPIEWWNNTTRDKVTFDTAFAEPESGWDITGEGQTTSYDRDLAFLLASSERILLKAQTTNDDFALGLILAERESSLAQARRMGYSLEEWGITARDQVSFDRVFAELDTTKKGYLTGELPTNRE